MWVNLCRREVNTYTQYYIPEEKRKIDIDIDIQTRMDYDDGKACYLSSPEHDEDQQQNSFTISSVSDNTTNADNLNSKKN
ncbi:unnamed protein product [Rotaria sp. Silwood2]|nr:unnamed protein product [Rotaria sp. Silwood2]CAF4340039.1 unnamed protein product [Rotaria sp. Silwood2]